MSKRTNRRKKDSSPSQNPGDVLAAPAMQGYVVEAQNLTGASIPTPVQDLAIPGLQAVAAEQQLLYPQPRTVEEQLAAAHLCKMYLVVK